MAGELTMSVGMARETLAELRKHIMEDEYALYYIWMPKASVLEALDTALATMPPDEDEEEEEEEEARIQRLREAQALDEDEADMAQIQREWDAFDRDPPGS